jgi:flavorubredoxin
MGVEEIDQVYFAPFLNSIFDKIKNCKIFLFGSYSWGNGEWLKKWEVSCLQLGLDIIETFKCKETPNKAQESELINLAEEMFYKYGEK